MEASAKAPREDVGVVIHRWLRMVELRGEADSGKMWMPDVDSLGLETEQVSEVMLWEYRGSFGCSHLQFQIPSAYFRVSDA